jgi:hypothetical protein
MVEKEVEEGTSLSTPTTLLVLAVGISLVMLEDWSASPDKVEKEVVRRNEQWMKAKRVWKQEWKSMGLHMHRGFQLYMCRHNVTICFPRKIFISISTIRAIRSWYWGAEMVGILKYFEVVASKRRNYRSAGQQILKNINSIGMAICPNRKEDNIISAHWPIELYV